MQTAKKVSLLSACSQPTNKLRTSTPVTRAGKLVTKEVDIFGLRHHERCRDNENGDDRLDLSRWKHID
jgi:hypothetical protein